MSTVQEMFASNGGGNTKLESDRAVIVLELLDSSGSMDHAQMDVIGALNKRRAALQPSPDAADLRMSMWTFNGQINVLHDFQPLDQTPVVDTKLYQPSGMTALYDTIREGIKAARSFRDTLQAMGASTHLIVAIYSDGEDTASASANAQDVANDIKSLLHEDSKCTVTFYAFGDRAKKEAALMGIPDKNVVTLSSSERDIRHALEVATPAAIDSALAN